MALGVLADAEIRHLSPDVITFSAAISALESEWERALSLLRLGQVRLKAVNVITYNSASTALGLCSEWRLALELMGEMASLAVAATTITYNAAITACESWPVNGKKNALQGG